MRAYLVSSIGVAAAAALLLPLAPTTAADHADRAGRTDRAAPEAPAPVPGAAPAAAPVAATNAGKQANEQLPGSTQSLPLSARAADAAEGKTLLAATSSAGAEDDDERGVERRKVKPFSLLGVVWHDKDVVVDGDIQVRTRSAVDGKWSTWKQLDTHADDRPDAAGREGTDARGATAPLWVGDSDGVEVRVQRGSSLAGQEAERAGHNHGTAAQEEGKRVVKGLPKGMSLELVTPGPEPAPPSDKQSSAAPTGQDNQDGQDGRSDAGDQSAEAPEGTEQSGQEPVERAEEQSDLHGEQRLEQSYELPALSRAGTEEEYGSGMRAGAADHVGPRPGIVTRKGWGADESLREKQFGYTKTVKTAFVHHTATSNDYKCSQAPSIIRGIYRYHVKSSKWRDIGYNFLVDKCGTIYEGRAGGVANPVMGAHTYGFNSNSTGIAVLGSHGSAAPSKEAVDGVAKLTAWKLGLHGVNAKGKATVTSGGGTKYPKGRQVSMNTISGHRDGFSTDCPGAKLYGKLGDVRSIAGRLQGR